MQEETTTGRLALVVVGTRPELIKLAPVIQQIEATSGWRSVVVFTGQHADLVDELAPQLGVQATERLDVMRSGKPLAALHGRLLVALDPVIVRWDPDVVIAQGDTTSVLAAATCAFYRRVPFAHVEAGLRTESIDSPFPEEMNRRAVAPLASFHFAPTEAAEERLLAEGISPARIFRVGNTVIDTLLEVVGRTPPPLDDGRAQVLVTVHRRENHGAPLRRIVEAVRRCATARPEARFLWPVHPNPAVRAVVHDALSDVENVELCDPLSYPALVGALRASSLVLTDSGGLQEEAPALDVPVLVVREDTERPEGVAAGCARLVGTQTGRIVDEVCRALDTDGAEFARGISPYGDGHASRRLVRFLDEHVAVPRWVGGTTGCSTEEQPTPPQHAEVA
jgi:UDP-N-acetylglucosamine 2-epimerase (non-hydrolysing)